MTSLIVAAQESAGTIVGIIGAVVALAASLGAGLVWVVKSMFSLIRKMIETSAVHMDAMAEKMDQMKEAVLRQTSAAIENKAATVVVADEVTTLRRSIEDQTNKLEVLSVLLQNRARD